MEFKSLTNIETSFRQIRLFALVFICLCALITGFAVWNSYSFAESQRQKIYVLDNLLPTHWKKSLEANQVRANKLVLPFPNRKYPPEYCLNQQCLP